MRSPEQEGRGGAWAGHASKALCPGLGLLIAP